MISDDAKQCASFCSGGGMRLAADKDGRWQVKLQPLSVTRGNESLTITVQGKNAIEIKDVLVGEVWICSGQSNMAWSLAQATDADLETKTARFPQIRLAKVERAAVSHGRPAAFERRGAGHRR